MRPLCRHCHVRHGARPGASNQRRGLCHRCYEDRGVRDLYPPQPSKFFCRGVGLGNRAGRPPLAPTPARPGTLEKVAELERRAAAGEQLWHPLDGRVPGPRGTRLVPPRRPAAPCVFRPLAEGAVA